MSINDVTVLEGIYDFDDSSKALVIKSVTMGGGGVKNYPELRDVIYGQPFRPFLHSISLSLFGLNAPKVAHGVFAFLTFFLKTNF